MYFKKFWVEWGWTVVLLISILLIGLFIRLYNLVELPIFADEAIYIRWAQVMKSESTLRFLPLSDGKQPLFMWLMIPFLKLFEDPLIAGRVTAVYAGLGTVVGMFFASYMLFRSKKVAIASSLIYALVPFAIFFDRMALADSLLTMYGVWTFALAIVVVRTLRLDLAMVTGFFLGGALLTKSPALYFSLLLPTLSILRLESLKKIKWLSIFKFLALLVPVYLIGYVMYNILRLGPNFHMLAIRNMDYVHPISHILVSPLDPLKPFLDRSRQFYWIMGTAPLIALWLYGYLVNHKKYLKEMLVLTVWFLVPIIISSEFSKTMTARYVLFSLPYLVLIAGSVLLATKGWLYKFGIFIIIVFIFQAGIYNYKLLTNVASADLPRSERSGYLEEWTAGQGIREIADYLKNEVKQNPDQKIVVGTEGYFGTLPDGLQIYFDKEPAVNVIGIGLELDKAPAALLDAQKAGNRVFLVANDERVNANLELAGLTKLKTYSKASRPDGSTQSLILYEVTKKAQPKD